MLNRIRKYRYEHLIRKGNKELAEAKTSSWDTEVYVCTKFALEYFARAASLFHSRDEAPEAYDAAADCCCILGDRKLFMARYLSVKPESISEEYKAAYDYYRRAEEYGRNIGDKRLQCMIGLAENEVKLRNYDKAESLYNEAAEQFSAPEARKGMYRCLYLRKIDEADGQKKAGNYEEALRLYGEALENLSKIHAADEEKIALYRLAEECCHVIGDEDGEQHYKDLYMPLLPLIERIGGENAWIQREDLLPEFLRRAQDALESGNGKLAVEYCEEAIRLYIERKYFQARSDTWEPDENYFDVFSMLMRSAPKAGAESIFNIRHTVSHAIAATNNFAVKRRLYKIWSDFLEEKGIDPLLCLGLNTSSKQISVGDTVLFGSYPQEDEPGDKTMPIEWEVLDVKGAELLLVSRYALDVVPYQADGKDVSWENTTLFNWLNGEFLNNAFSAEERDRIGESGIECLSFGDLWAYYNNDRYGRLGTYGDEKAVFSHLLAADGTPYAAAKGLCRWHFDDEADFDIHGSIWCSKEPETQGLHFNSADRSEMYGRGGVCWWLRADEKHMGRLVTQDGVAEKAWYRKDATARKDVGVRPVLWISP